MISRLQSPSAVIWGPKKIKSDTVSMVSPSICHKGMGLDATIIVSEPFLFLKHRTLQPTLTAPSAQNALPQIFKKLVPHAFYVCVQISPCLLTSLIPSPGAPSSSSKPYFMTSHLTSAILYISLVYLVNHPPLPSRM